MPALTPARLNDSVALLKVREVIRLVENHGWYHLVTNGSHRQYKHPVKKGRVTIAGHPCDDLRPGNSTAS